jgi:hypothetical protein
LEVEMKMIHGIILKAVVAATAVSAFGAPALARHWEDDRGWYDHRDDRQDNWRRDDWRRDDWRDRRDRYDDDVRLRGPGVYDLNPWFRNAKAGRLFAARRAGTYITSREAWMLNREYRYR